MNFTEGPHTWLLHQPSFHSCKGKLSQVQSIYQQVFFRYPSAPSHHPPPCCLVVFIHCSASYTQCTLGIFCTLPIFQVINKSLCGQTVQNKCLGNIFTRQSHSWSRNSFLCSLLPQRNYHSHKSSSFAYKLLMRCRDIKQILCQEIIYIILEMWGKIKIFQMVPTFSLVIKIKRQIRNMCASDFSVLI